MEKTYEGVIVDTYTPKEKKDIRQRVNTVFIKNFPKNWTEEQLKEYFGKYGDI